jgi:hypothetical protein
LNSLKDISISDIRILDNWDNHIDIFEYPERYLDI